MLCTKKRRTKKWGYFMKALRLFGKNDIRMVEIPIPTINESEILIRTDVAAVCDADIKMLQNGQTNANVRNTLTLGHEFAGTVAKVGSNVDNYKEGMKVAVAPAFGCGICGCCASGRNHLCDSYKTFGVDVDGGMAEYVAVPKNAVQSGSLILLPKGVTPAMAALNTQLSSAYNGALKLRVAPGDVALIVGAGLLGIMYAMLLKLLGVSKVIITDSSKSKLGEAIKIVPDAKPYHGSDLAEYVAHITNGNGADVAVITEKTNATQNSLFSLMGFLGRVCVAEFGHNDDVSIDAKTVCEKELVLTGVAGYSKEHFRKTLELMAQGYLPVDKTITGEYGIDEVLTAFENKKNDVGIKNILLF